MDFNAQMLISAWNGILLNFFGAFTLPTAQTFTEMATAWIIATGRRTVCTIYSFVDPNGRRAHDAYHRFFPDAAWEMSELWKIWIRLLAARYYPEGKVPLILDDTLFHKTGRKVDGASWWRDAVRSTKRQVVKALGLNLVVIVMRVNPPWGGEPIGIPVHVRLHRKNGTGPLQLAEEMMDDIARWLPESSFVLTADGFYAPLAGRDLPRTVLISRLRRDAAIYDLPPKRHRTQRGRPRKKGERLPSPKEIAENVQLWDYIEVNERGKIRYRMVYTLLVLWYGVCSDKPVKLVIVRDPDQIEKDDFFFTTDIGMSADEVVESYSGRWCVEDTFKNTKSVLGGEEPQVWKDGAPERASAFSLLLYGLVWVWYLEHGHGSVSLVKPLWYRQKLRPSFADALCALRKVHWQFRISPKSEHSPGLMENLKHLIEAAAKAA